MDNTKMWIERGESLIFPERYENWQMCVTSYMRGIDGNFILSDTLKLIEALENDVSMEEVKKMFDEQGHSLLSSLLVRKNVFSFSSKGPEFWEATENGEITPEAREIIEAKKRENHQLAQNNIKKNLLKM